MQLNKFATALMLSASISAVLAETNRIENVGAPNPSYQVQEASIEGRLTGVAKLLTPKGWKGYISNNINGDKESTFTKTGRELWTESLNRWLLAEGLRARLDWNKKLVYIEQAKIQVPTNLAAGATSNMPVPAQIPDTKVNQWDVKISDLRLETTLTRWAQQAGYRLLWDADRHILITGEDHFKGDFFTALNRILASPAIRESDYPVEAVIYANTPPLIRITRLGEQNLNK